MPSKSMPVTRELGRLDTRATVRPATLNEEQRTVDVVWTTGERVKRGMFEPFYEELSLDPAHVRLERLRNGAPVLDSHHGGDSSMVVGAVDSVRMERDRGIATLRFAAGDERSDGIWRKIQQGVMRNVSVGYRVHRLEEQRERADDGLPVFRATSWEPMEISVVPIGADSGATVRSNGADVNRCEFVLAERKTAMPEETQIAPGAENGVEQVRNAAQAAPVPAPAPVAPAVDADAVRKAERERIGEIQRVARGLGLDDVFAEQHVAAGTGLDDFRAAAFDKYAEGTPPAVPPGGPAVVAGDDERDKSMRAASNWIIQRSGLADLVTKAEGEKVEGAHFRGMTFVELAREFLSKQGHSVRGLDKMALFGKAFTTRAGGMTATGDFTVLLDNTISRILLAQYAITSDKWSQFCSTGSVPDFREVKRLRMGTFGSLDTVIEHGEFTRKAIPDARAESISATTKGNTIALTRQVLVNDDIGFVTRMATMLGRAARLSIEVDVFALLAENSGLGPNMADGNPLFDASHGNLGAGATLSIAALDANATILAEQTDESGNETLEIDPYALLVPRGLQSKALQINGAEFDVDLDAAGSTKSRVPNVVQGMFERVIGSTRMPDATRRYIFANPAVVPTIEVVFLDGIETPFLESRNGFTIDGVEWKVRLDYGVAAIDYRGAVTDAGV